MSNRKTIATEHGLEITSSEGDKSSFILGSQGDFYINNPKRRSQGRALVVLDDALHINFRNDFKGGVIIEGLNLGHLFGSLPKAPQGTETFQIVIDSSGNLYRKD